MPDISICMITYNHELFIEQAINSILSQKTKYSFQLVIGEDCGTDATRSICERFAEKYPDKIKLLPSQKNYGVVPNFIRTLDACDGRYIALCEGDDYWIDNDKLQAQVDFLETHSDYILCAGRSQYLNYSGEITSIDERADKTKVDFSIKDYLLKMCFETASIVYRNNKDFKLPDSYKNVFSADQFLVLLLTMNNGKIRYLDKDISVYRYHAGGITKKTDPKIILDKLFSMLDEFDKISEFKYHQFILLRKKFTLFGWNYKSLNYPKRLLFLFSNLKIAFIYRKFIPFNYKIALRYLAPFKI